MFSIFHSYCGQLKDFGIDWFGPAVIHDDEAGAVSVPDTIIPLQPHEMAVLHTLHCKYLLNYVSTLGTACMCIHSVLSS